MTVIEDKTTLLPHVMLRRDLVARGWRDRAIAGMVKSGAWTKVRTGAYVDRATWDALDVVGKHRTRTRAVLQQSKTDLVVSHTSAMCELGIEPWDLSLDVVHVTRPDGRAGRAAAGIQQHCGAIGADDTREVEGVRSMVAARVALEVTMLGDVEHGLVAMNQLLQLETCDLSAIAVLAESMELWPGSLATGLVLRLADPLCTSVAESRTYFLCWHHGLPMPQKQVPVADRSGQVVAYVDFAWPEHKVFLEFDGKVKYTTLLKPGETAADVLLRERRRERLVMELTGWRCIRLTWADLENPVRTARRIRQALEMPYGS